MTSIRQTILILALTGLVPAPAAADPHPSPTPLVAPWPGKANVQPKDLAARLGKKDAPLVIQVSFDYLYKEGHIPGALHTGPGYKAEGIAALRKLARKLPRDREIVLYCGCCPSEECPNLIPAYKAMRAMGFKRLSVLELESDFHVDWALEGLPTVKAR